MRIPRAKIRLTAIFPLSWHPPLDIVRGERRNALTGPGSRRLGGVEATGASPGVAPSRPHRLGPPAPPGWCARCLTGGWGPGGGGGGAPTWRVGQIAPWGRGLRTESGRAIARPAFFFLPGGRGAALAGVSRDSSLQSMRRRSLPASRPRVGISAPVLLALPVDVPMGRLLR